MQVHTDLHHCPLYSSLRHSVHVSFQSWPGPSEQPINHSCLPSQWKTRRYLVAPPVAHKISLPGAFLSICHSLPGAEPLTNLGLAQAGSVPGGGKTTLVFRGIVWVFCEDIIKRCFFLDKTSLLTENCE